MFAQRPIFITGAARSGTSMTAGSVHLCGAWGGDMAGATPNNRRGMFENTHIRQNVIKPYLRSIEADPLGQDPLPEWDRVIASAEQVADRMHKEFNSMLQVQGYPGGPWFYKGAKMCLFWPVMHQAFPQAKWVIVRRADADIVNSCMKTGFMRAFRHEAGWFGWVEVHKRRFEQMKSVGAELQVREVWPQKMIFGQFDEIRNVVEWLGLRWDAEKVTNFIEPALWSRAKHRRRLQDGQ